MASDNEPAKLLLPYLQRADELQKHEPLVAYYCRLYAMERGLKIPQNERTKTTNALLVSLMNQLEKDKKSLKLGPEDNLYLEGFALNLFAKADKQDRAGRADLNTAKTFYAASIFFEILNQFGELPPDLEQKQKYSAWKAADIRKALKEGRKPEPGPPTGDDDLSIPSTISMPTSTSLPNLPSRTSSGASDLERSTAGTDTIPKQEKDQSSQTFDKVNRSHSTNIPPSPPSYTPPNYPSHDFHSSPPPSSNISHDSLYIHPYHQQPYSQDFHQIPENYSPHESQIPQNYSHHESQIPQNYSPHESLPQSYPNFQSYPSFTESSLPAAPSHYPSSFQGPDVSSYSTHAVPSVTTNPSPLQYSSSSRSGTVSEPERTSTSRTFQYDSNYQPPPEKIAEAHKAARFAVGALAFDDVVVAVDFLKRSLELLTNPSAGQ